MEAGRGHDSLPVEVRRENWGWFGEPWWSFTCYDEDGQLIDEMRKPFPAGEKCLLCDEEFSEAAGDSGQAVPAVRAGGRPSPRYWTSPGSSAPSGTTCLASPGP